MGYTKAILTLLFLLIMALPTASAGWKDLFDDSSYTTEDWADEAGCEADGWAVGAGYPQRFSGEHTPH